MTTPAEYAFILAYKCWLETDAHYLDLLRGKALTKPKFDEVGLKYGITRNIKIVNVSNYIAMVNGIGPKISYGVGINLTQRAYLLAVDIQNFTACPPGNNLTTSATSKFSWFIWPDNWTMFDKFVAGAVLGASNSNSISRFLKFYLTLEQRGWTSILTCVRNKISQRNPLYKFDILLAERTIDKYLWLSYCHSKGNFTQIQKSLDNFIFALPNCLGEEVRATSLAIAPCLNSGKLLHPVTEDEKKERAGEALLIEKRLEGLMNGSVDE